MKPVKYIAIAEAGKFRIVNDKLFREELSRLDNGRYDIIIQKHKRHKSNPQLGYYFSCCLPMFIDACTEEGIGIEDSDGVLRKMTLEEGDAFAKSLFCKENIIDRHSGQVFSIPGQKRNMTTTEMNAFINQLRDYSSEYLNTYIPEPCEQIKMEI